MLETAATLFQKRQTESLLLRGISLQSLRRGSSRGTTYKMSSDDLMSRGREAIKNKKDAVEKE